MKLRMKMNKELYKEEKDRFIGKKYLLTNGVCF